MMTEARLRELNLLSGVLLIDWSWSRIDIIEGVD